MGHPYGWFGKPLIRRHCDAAELSLIRDHVRPIEPFLSYPEELFDHCAEPLRPLLRKVLAARALKTASVYGYWGLWRQSQELVKRFVELEDWGLPYFATAMVACTPVGGWMGYVLRKTSR